MLLMKSPTMAVYVSVWMHTLLQPVGEGEFTCENDKARSRVALCGLRFEFWSCQSARHTLCALATRFRFEAGFAQTPPH